MLETLKNLDRELLIRLNSHHNAFWDPIMVLFSERLFWFPAYFLLAVFLVYAFKKRGLLMVGLLLVVAGLSDRISSGLIKTYFNRLRPCHDPTISEAINIVSGCGGKFGFISSHASNTFAMAVFLAMVLPPKFRNFKIGLFIWAVVVSYSRIYLGVHYPGDVIAGAMLGALLAWIFAKLYCWLVKRYAFFNGQEQALSQEN